MLERRVEMSVSWSQGRLLRRYVIPPLLPFLLLLLCAVNAVVMDGGQGVQFSLDPSLPSLP